MTLVSEPQYRQLTGDMKSSVGAVTGALSLAQGLVEARLNRTLSYGTYTDSLRVTRYGYYYLVSPYVTPLDPSNPGYVDASTLRVDPGSYTWTYWDQSVTFEHPPISVTYTGGYHDGELPKPLQHAISLIAQFGLNPPSVSMANVKMIHTGDQAIMFEKAPDALWPPAAWALARRYARLEVLPA